MRTFCAVVIAFLALFASSVPAMAQGSDTLRANGAVRSDFSIGAGFIVGGMRSQVIDGTYIDATIGKSRINLSYAQEITSNPSLNFVDNLPSPEPSFKRVSLTYGQEIVGGLASIVILAGPEYTWGVADGKYLYNERSGRPGDLGTDYYEPDPISRLGLTLEAGVDVPVSRHFAFGVRSSLTIDKVESYGLFGMMFGYIFQ